MYSFFLLSYSEVLHRGAATRGDAGSGGGGEGWVSTCSIELCSPAGWTAWGDNPDSKNDDWRMLDLRCLGGGEGKGEAKGEAGHSPAGKRRRQGGQGGGGKEKGGRHSKGMRGAGGGGMAVGDGGD